MCRAFTPLLLLLAAPALAAPVPKAVKAKGNGLEGTWEAKSMTMNGRDILPGNSSVWVIRGDTLVRNTRGPDGTLVPSNPEQPIEFKANPERPGELDYTQRNGGQANLWRALFEVKGDEFTISFGDLNADRPAELKEGVGVYFYRFKRVDEKK